MLDPNLWELYDRYKMAYANILYRWRLFTQRTEILKFISTPMPAHKGIGEILFLFEFFFA